MLTYTRFTTLALLCMVIVSSNAQNCGEGLLACAGQCYDQGTASCEINKEGKEILCGFQHLPDTTPDRVCGSTCYDTIDYGCCNDTDTIYQLVNGDGSCPIPAPVPPPSGGCASSDECGDGLECCNQFCYNPATASCAISSNGNPVLCGFQHLPDTTPDAACNNICYDTLYYGCCASTGQIYDLTAPIDCPADTTAPTSSPTSPPASETQTNGDVCAADADCGEGLACCSGQCYNPGTASCETSNTGAIVLCGFQHLPDTTPDAACGTHCYDTLYYGCCNSNNEIYDLSNPSVCPDNAPATTFAPSSAPATFAPTSAPATEAPSQCGCASGLECCNGQCYNPGTASCETSNTGEIVLCGFQHLPETTPDAACGTHCYDTLYYGCCNSNNEIYDLSNPSTCPDNAPATTFAPSSAPTTFAPSSAPATEAPSQCGCDSGLECCNGQCYNPGTASCETSNTGAIVLCGFQHLPATTPDAACGTTCYDTADYGCCNSTSTIYDLTIPSACADFATSAPATPAQGASCGGSFCAAGLSCCGSSCYDSSNSVCITNSNQLQVICSNTDSVCISRNGAGQLSLSVAVVFLTAFLAMLM